MRRHAMLPALALLCGGLLGGCAGTVSDAYVIEDDPGQVEHADDSEIGRVTLTEQAAARLGIELTPVVARGRRLVVPATAVFVDPEGTWWVYTSPEPLSYERHEVVIQRDVDGEVLLSQGPAAGTDVVTVGVAELYGVEDAVGH